MVSRRAVFSYGRANGGAFALVMWSISELRDHHWCGGWWWTGLAFGVIVVGLTYWRCWDDV